MFFIHKGFGIRIDDESERIRNLLNKLKDQYKNVPKTKCVKCPGKEKVVADCCRTFSPPILFSEFISILFDLYKNKSKEEIAELFYKCFETFLIPDYEKPCVLLDSNDLCSVYQFRPFACRMFGQYDKVEWNSRLENISKELGVPKEQVPFCNQCEGVKVKSKQQFKKISKEKSDFVFKKIYELDVDVFPEKFRKQAIDIVSGSYTYLPFETHFLLLNIGQDKLEQLTDMKLRLRDLKSKKDQLEYIKYKKEIDDFLKHIKSEIENVNNKG